MPDESLEPGAAPPHGLMARLRASEAYRSIFRTPPLDTARGRALKCFGNVFLHLYPVKVPWRVLQWRYSFRLGYITTVLFVILAVTGTYLMFFYTPSVANAYGDMQRLRAEVGFGQLLRNVHRWGAHLMVLATALHVGRVMLTGAYAKPRQFNWVIGVGLLIVTLAYSFTGYLLPWDQLSYWAVRVASDLVHYVPFVGTELRALLLGGSTIGQSTLLRFYVLHVAVLTIFFFLLIAVHIWRVRKDGFAVARGGAPPWAVADGAPLPEGRGERPDTPYPVAPDERVRLLGVVERTGVEREPPEEDDTVFTWPHLIVRHQVIAFAVVAICLAMGIAFEAPLRELANPNLTHEPAKAPWYFVGLQELLAHFDPVIAGVLVPIVLGAWLVFLPYLDRNAGKPLRERRVAVATIVLLGIIALVLTIIGALFRGPGWVWVLPWEHWYFEP
ncbi:MAG: cytochrome b N-terminal domain-containing protein [Gemmatimonadetes bacterium]|nr:cytochrome b N-terminal domain-containing protein [Gemmatimonadota bacterium]